VANGAYISVAGQPPKSLTGQGATFVKSFGKQIGAPPNPYSQYGAQAMQVMLQAVTAGGGDRSKTTKSLFGIHINNGIIGNFSINSTGDINLTPITIYRQAGKNLMPVKTLIPAANLVGG
jgi:ABC-type branched-subunit amino acid transport system substrate-binding protein